MRRTKLPPKSEKTYGTIIFSKKTTSEILTPSASHLFRNPQLWGYRKGCSRDTSLLLFLHLAPLRLGLLNNLFLQLRWDNVVVVHLHAEAAAALGHGGEVNPVGQHFGHGHFGFHNRVAAFVVHALNAAAPTVQVAHDRAGKFIRNRDLDHHDWLEQRGLGLLHGFLEGDASGHLE